ncbi:MAG: aldo/keto reductase [Actinomycetota bacterium]|nr:aldo/keto reductase [Actinomycetota bacterium]
MRTQRLGTNGPEITRVGFGAWAVGGGNKFGWSGVDDDRSIEAIRSAIQNGVNWVDTAAFYGKGHSEDVVAKALAPFEVGEEVFVFTKCGLRWDPSGGPNAAPRNDLTPQSIRFECEQSLSRLKVERIDLFQFHWPDETGTLVEESWQTMLELQAEGKVRWIGVSNFDVDLLERCHAVHPLDSVQPELSLVSPDRRNDVIPWAKNHGVGVLVYSPMGSGLLTGKFDRARAENLPADDWRRDAPAFNEPLLSRNLELVDRLQEIAGRVGCSLPELAVAWTLTVEGVSAAIVGAKSPEQVGGWIDAPEIELDEAVLQEIEALLG